MRQLILSDLAVEQLKDVPAKTGSQIFVALERLRSFPESAPRLSAKGYEGYRQLIVQRYRVVYRYITEDDTVRIYCILHVHRQLPSSEFLTYQIF